MSFTKCFVRNEQIWRDVLHVRVIQLNFPTSLAAVLCSWNVSLKLHAETLWLKLQQPHRKQPRHTGHHTHCWDLTTVYWRVTCTVRVFLSSFSLNKHLNFVYYLINWHKTFKMCMFQCVCICMCVLVCVMKAAGLNVCMLRERQTMSAIQCQAVCSKQSSLSCPWQAEAQRGMMGWMSGRENKWETGRAGGSRQRHERQRGCVNDSGTRRQQTHSCTETNHATG